MNKIILTQGIQGPGKTARITEDIITFIEQYCLVNGKPIKLKDYQKKFIKWINLLKLEKGYQNG